MSPQSRASTAETRSSRAPSVHAMPLGAHSRYTQREPDSSFLWGVRTCLHFTHEGVAKRKGPVDQTGPLTFELIVRKLERISSIQAERDVVNITCR